MAYEFNDSDKFKANLFLLLGTVLSTPLCMLILATIKDSPNFDLASWFTSITLFISGILIIVYSHGIMILKDKKAHGEY